MSSTKIWKCDFPRFWETCFALLGWGFCWRVSILRPFFLAFVNKPNSRNDTSKKINDLRSHLSIWKKEKTWQVAKMIEQKPYIWWKLPNGEFFFAFRHEMRSQVNLVFRKFLQYLSLESVESGLDVMIIETSLFFLILLSMGK